MLLATRLCGYLPFRSFAFLLLLNRQFRSFVAHCSHRVGYVVSECNRLHRALFGRQVGSSPSVLGHFISLQLVMSSHAPSSYRSEPVLPTYQNRREMPGPQCWERKRPIKDWVAAMRCIGALLFVEIAVPTIPSNLPMLATLFDFCFVNVKSWQFILSLQNIFVCAGMFASCL